MNDRLKSRFVKALAEREANGTKRSLGISDPNDGFLNLANNDYLNLACDTRLKKAGREAIDQYGCSSSASPLITGFGPAHHELLNTVKSWHGFEEGLLWNSGYVANQALLSLLTQKGDLVLADRLIHNSIISGILSSGARLIRYRHCDLPHLKALLEEHAEDDRMVFVVTESVFSMDGDFPDLKEIAELKKRYKFFWILDEAHAVGWYGAKGSGLVEECGVVDQVDVLVGTLGKALGSMGAYTLFHNKTFSDYLVNFSGELIYSTYLSPASAAVANEAVRCVRESGALRKKGREASERIRKRLREMGWDVKQGDSPIISIPMGDASRAIETARKLEEKRIKVGAVRPPTVPEGTSRLRVSLKADLEDDSIAQVLQAFAEMVQEKE